MKNPNQPLLNLLFRATTACDPESYAVAERAVWVRMYAGMAMSGLIADYYKDEGSDAESMARRSVAIAESLVHELENRGL